MFFAATISEQICSRRALEYFNVGSNASAVASLSIDVEVKLDSFPGTLQHLQSWILFLQKQMDMDF
jgi:hypothetical protein